MNQSSILSFVDTPEHNCAQERTPRSRSLKRHSKTGHKHQRHSSTSSLSAKRKLSGPENGNTITKKLIMETPTPKEGHNPPGDVLPHTLTKALKDMEDRINNNFKTLIEPLQKSIDSLVKSKNEWEAHKDGVTTLKNKHEKLETKLTECY